MKLISNKDNVYVFRSICYAFDLFGLLLICLSAKLFFYDNEIIISTVCLYLAFLAIYIGTVYCKVIIDLNQGIVFSKSFMLFKYRNYAFAIDEIEKISSDIQRRPASNGIYYTSFSITTTSQDNNVTRFVLGTSKEKVQKSVELMNSLLEQYKQKQGTNSEIAKSPCSKP
jgi:hypothetical protein